MFQNVERQADQATEQKASAPADPKAAESEKEPVAWSDGFHESISLTSESIGERSAVETRQMKNRIALIARVFSKNYQMQVIPSPRGGWACTIGNEAVQALHEYLQRERDTLDDLPDEMFDATTILYDAQELRTIPEEQIMGVMRHEVGHANFSDFRCFFKGQRHAVDEGCLPTTWMEIHNALEDPWVNIKESNGSAVVEHNMAKLYERWTADVVANIGSQTLLRQLGLNIIHHWLYQKNIPTLKNKEVLKVFETIEPYVDEFFVGDNAKENYELLKEKIWPHVAPLEEASTEQEIKKMLSEALSEKESKSWIPGPFRRAMKRVRKALGIQSEKEKLEDKLKEALKNDKSGKQLAKDLKEELDRQKNEREKQNKEIQEQGHPTGKLADDIDIDDLSDEAKKALQEWHDKLPEDLKEELRKAARGQLDDKQAKDLKDGLPKTMEMSKDPKTGQNQARMKPTASDREVQKAQDKAKREEERVKREAEKQRERSEAEDKKPPETKGDDDVEYEERSERERRMKRMQEAGFGAEEESLYNDFIRLEQEVDQQIRSLSRLLEKEFPRKANVSYEGEYFIGKKVNKESLPKRVPIKDYRILSRKKREYTLEPLLTVDIWIDRSGSMMGDKMDAARRTAITLGRLLKEYDIPFCLGAFAGDSERIKTGEQDYDSPQHRIKPHLISRTDGQGWSTNIGAPIRAASEELERTKRLYPGYMPIVILISDSDANSGAQGDSLKDMIGDLQQKANVVSIILGATEGEVALSRYYFGEDNVVAPESFEDLPRETLRVIAKMMRKFKRRNRME